MKETDELQRELQNFIDNVFLSRVALSAIQVIRERTLKGEFKEGAKQYSAKPFAMPLGALTKQLQAGILTRGTKTKSKFYDPDNFKVFSAKSSGNLWVVINQGYRKLRQLAGKSADHVNLSWTGRMMSGLSITRQSAGQADVGFTNSDAQQKALYHNILGAGRSKKKHVFMYLTELELDKIIELALKV